MSKANEPKRAKQCRALHTHQTRTKTSPGYTSRSCVSTLTPSFKHATESSPTANVEVAFPCLFKGFPNTIEYKICIAAHPDKRYQASVFWGNPGQLKQKAFLQGSVAATMHLALESLCLASSELISVLQGKGLLVKASLQVGRTYLAKSGGFFDSNPEFWPM